MIYLLYFVVHCLLFHPFHVSVSEVKYKEDEKVIQISTRIFLDDLEEALKIYGPWEKLEITDETQWEGINELLGKYLLEKVKLSSEKGEYDVSYIGAEIEGDVMWAYLEVEKVKKLKQVVITNYILLDVFDDQENIVHFRAFDKVKSSRLYKDKERVVFTWE